MNKLLEQLQQVKASKIRHFFNPVHFFKRIALVFHLNAKYRQSYLEYVENNQENAVIVNPYLLNIFSIYGILFFLFLGHSLYYTYLPLFFLHLEPYFMGAGIASFTFALLLGLFFCIAQKAEIKSL